MANTTLQQRAEIDHLMGQLTPDDLSAEALDILHVVLHGAWLRKTEPLPEGVTDLDSVRSRRRPRR